MARVVRFGAFEIDLDAGELRKNGLKLRLQEQPQLHRHGICRCRAQQQAVGTSHGYKDLQEPHVIST